MTRMARLADAAWAMVPWWMGLTGLVVLARQDGAFAWALGAAIAAWVTLALGVVLRRGWVLDLAIVPLGVATASESLDLAIGSRVEMSLASLAACALGHTMAQHVVRKRDAPLAAIAAKASSRLACATVLAWLVIKALDWSSRLVSGRWSASLDRSSAEMTVASGALLLALAAAFTWVRVAVRRSARDPALP